MPWYLRSTGDADTHRGQLRPDGTVVAECGAQFRPPPIVPGGPALPGEPPDPDQICPDCYRGRSPAGRRPSRS